MNDLRVSVARINNKTEPACRRCRKHTKDVGSNEWQPMLCLMCCTAIAEDYPYMVPLEKPDATKAKLCLTEHRRECECWQAGLRFPDDSVKQAALDKINERSFTFRYENCLK